jgi:hypothetical protein
VKDDGLATVLVEHIRAARKRRGHGLFLMVPVDTREHGIVELKVPTEVADADLEDYVAAFLGRVGCHFPIGNVACD